VLGGKHGDHIGGEREAALALMAGEIDAAWMIDGNHQAFSREGILPASATRIVARTGLYDHCNFTVSPGAPQEQIARFTELLLAMRWDDPQVRPLLELEGLKTWLPGRTSGYELLIRPSTMRSFMTLKETSLLPIIDIEDLGLDAGAHLLIKHGLLGVPPGADIGVVGRSPGWEAQLSAWCRSQAIPWC